MSSDNEPRVSGPRDCPIADALQLVGDRWTLLALRELTLGVTRFNNIRINTGAPRASLAARLRAPEESGLVHRRRYHDHPPRDDYLLTEAGKALGPVLRELYHWGTCHAAPQRPFERIPLHDG